MEISTHSHNAGSFADSIFRYLDFVIHFRAVNYLEKDHWYLIL